MQIPIYNSRGERIKLLDISDHVFGVSFNEPLVHQAFVAQMANRRQGTAYTRGRSEVKGSTGKFFQQKGTGRARRGSLKSPLLRGGGVVFGPKPRSYRQAMPKKMRRLALRCVLSAKAREGTLRAIDALEFERPKTKKMAQILSALNVDGSVLVVTEESKPAIVKSAQNLPEAKVLPATLMNVVDLLGHDVVIATVAALQMIERTWGTEAAQHASV